MSPDRINYLTLWFWVLRSVVAFVVWIGLAFLLRSALHSYDESGSDDAQRRVRNIAGVGAVFFAVTGAFVASVDWTMSLDPYWFSSLYGWLAVARQAMVGLAFLIVTLLFLVRYESVANVVNQRVVNDLAMLQLGTIMVWGYMQYFQYLIMWHANLPKEARWYEPRMTGGWEYFALFLIVFNLVIPLILLLIPVPKKTLAYVSIVSVLVLISHWVEVTWIVQPAFSPTLAISWLDIVLPLAVGALWLAGYFWFLGKERLIPVHHPVLDDLAEVEGDSFAHGELDTPASAVN